MEGVPVRSTLVCIGGIGWLYAGAFNVWLVCGVFFFFLSIIFFFRVFIFNFFVFSFFSICMHSFNVEHIYIKHA